MRKSLEADLSMIRAERGAGATQVRSAVLCQVVVPPPRRCPSPSSAGATQAMVDDAVARAMREQGNGVGGGGGGGGGGPGAAALEEKVKECGRMILRMGSELMEETKLRLQLVRRRRRRRSWQPL